MEAASVICFSDVFIKVVYLGRRCVEGEAVSVGGCGKVPPVASCGAVLPPVNVLCFRQGWIVVNTHLEGACLDESMDFAVKG